MDGFGSTNGSVGVEEGSDGGEDSVGDSDGGVDGEVKHQVGARVVGGRKGLHGGGQGGPGREDFLYYGPVGIQQLLCRKGVCDWRTYINPPGEKSSR